jgi:hypothetical protein
MSVQSNISHKWINEKNYSPHKLRKGNDDWSTAVMFYMFRFISPGTLQNIVSVSRLVCTK